MLSKLPDTLPLPNYIPIVFGLVVLFTLIQFYRIIKQSTNYGAKANLIIGGLLFLVIIQSVLSLKHFYSSNTMTTPPRFAFAIIPAIVVILFTFISKKGHAFIDSLPLLPITWLNIVRVPVEFCLYWLFLEKAVPELMTFAGRNFDILAGITAPFIAYFGLQKQIFNKKLILTWNILSLGLLLFIVFNALLSAPTILQQFAFEQPNIALVYFPFILLPTLVVPVVLFGHLVSIRQLSNEI